MGVEMFNFYPHPPSFSIAKTKDSMKYYCMKNSATPAKIGRRFPQIEKLVDRETYPHDSENSLSRFNPWGRLPDDAVIPEYVLYKSAKLTDLISSSWPHSNLKIMSKKLYNLIQDFNIPLYQSFETKVYAKNIPYTYYVFFIPMISYELIDFENSEFALYPMNARKIRHESLDINSITDYEQCIKKHPFLVKENPERLKVTLEKLAFIENVPFDLFRILGPTPSGYSYFVSERLKNAIEKDNCTGIDIISLEDIQF
jgi:hypothetical protein